MSPGEMPSEHWQDGLSLLPKLGGPGKVGQVQLAQLKK